MRLIAAAFLALAACTTTPAKLADNPVEFSISSTKPAKAFATCIAEHLRDGQLRSDSDDHLWVLRGNMYGSNARWDIYTTAGGSRADFRHVVSTGDATIGRRCA